LENGNEKPSVNMYLVEGKEKKKALLYFGNLAGTVNLSYTYIYLLYAGLFYHEITHKCKHIK
jgi:hypothetical protein